MSQLVPSSRPRITTEELHRLLAAHQIDLSKWPLMVIGIRGYYMDTMGEPGANDRGLYDDAIILHSANVTANFNGNTDPSSFRRGRGTGEGKGMASLKPGFWPVYRFAQHRGKYLALCQRAGEVTVIRDGSPSYEDTGEFGINIHRGAESTTSSLGCQTVPPDQWVAFISLAVSEAKRLFGSAWQESTIPYLLIVNHQ